MDDYKKYKLVEPIIPPLQLFKNEEGRVFDKSDLSSIPETLKNERELTSALKIYINLEFSEHGKLYTQLKHLFMNTLNLTEAKIHQDELREDITNFLHVIQSSMFSLIYELVDVPLEDKLDTFIKYLIPQVFLAKKDYPFESKNIHDAVTEYILFVGVFNYIKHNLGNPNSKVIQKVSTNVDSYEKLMKYIKFYINVSLINVINFDVRHDDEVKALNLSENQLQVLTTTTYFHVGIFYILLHGSYEKFMNFIYIAICEINEPEEGINPTFKLDDDKLIMLGNPNQLLEMSGPDKISIIDHLILQELNATSLVIRYSVSTYKEKIRDFLLAREKKRAEIEAKVKEAKKQREAEELRLAQEKSDKAAAELLAMDEADPSAAGPSAAGPGKKKKKKKSVGRSVSQPLPEDISLPEDTKKKSSSVPPTISPIQFEKEIDKSDCKLYQTWNTLCNLSKKNKNAFKRWYRVIEKINYWNNEEAEKQIEDHSQLNNAYISLIGFLGVVLFKNKSLPKYAIKGGCLRDVIRGANINDIDILVYDNDRDATPLQEFKMYVREKLMEWVSIVGVEYTLSDNSATEKQEKISKFMLQNTEGKVLNIEIANASTFYKGPKRLPIMLDAYDYDINQLKIDITNVASGYLGLTLSFEEMTYLEVSIRSVLTNIIEMQGLIIKQPSTLFNTKGVFNQLPKVINRVTKNRIQIKFPSYVHKKYGDELVNLMVIYIYLNAFASMKEDKEIGNDKIVKEKLAIMEKIPEAKIKDYDLIARSIAKKAGGSKTMKRKRK